MHLATNANSVEYVTQSYWLASTSTIRFQFSK